LGSTFFHPKRSPLAGNRFLQAAKGAENTKAKIEAVLYVYVRRAPPLVEGVTKSLPMLHSRIVHGPFF